jgi:hypothetical protein
MNQRALYEWRRRSLGNGWTFYLWAVSFTLGLAVLGYLTLRRGLEVILTDPTVPWLLAFCSITLIQFWLGRPRRKKPRESI